MAREILPASYSEAGSAQYLKDARAVAEEVLMRAAERVATKKVLDARNRGIWTRFKRWFKGLFEEKSLADIADENLAQIALDVLQRERRFDVKLSGRSPKTSRILEPYLVVLNSRGSKRGMGDNGRRQACGVYRRRL